MTEQQMTQAFEIERKYEVAPEAVRPGREEFAGSGLTPDSPQVHDLHAIYFDAPGQDLARQRLALRVRHGGTDAGWHLKEKGAAGSTELMWPPAETMPDELREVLRQRVGAAADDVRPIAELRTQRTVVLLRAEQGGAALVEFADDQVRSLDCLTGVRRAWREWEAELIADADVDATVLDRVEPILLAAGARPSPSPAKIARATGSLIAWAEALGADETQLAALSKLDEADQAAARRLEP